MKGISETKLAVIEYARPIETDEPAFWWPEFLIHSGVDILASKLVHKWENPNEHLATYMVVITEEDANYLLLKYPAAKGRIKPWPRNFDNLDK